LKKIAKLPFKKLQGGVKEKKNSEMRKIQKVNCQKDKDNEKEERNIRKAQR
jgi:hypothetical protein